MNSNYVIGFAGTMYTLWTKHTEKKYLYAGFNKQEEVTYIVADFVKNISKSLEAAKELYPDAEVDLTLKGTHWEKRESGTYVEHPADEFAFGKYCNQKITECTDLNYLGWYQNQGITSAALDVVKNRIKELNFAAGKTFEVEGCYYSEDEYNELMAKKNAYVEFVEKMHRHEPIEVTFSINFSLNDDWDEASNSVYDGSEMGTTCFILKKGSFVMREYNGFRYALPSIKGKGKLIKNKVMRITDYDYEDTPNEFHFKHNIIIKAFEVVKK